MKMSIEKIAGLAKEYGFETEKVDRYCNYAGSLIKHQSIVIRSKDTDGNWKDWFLWDSEEKKYVGDNTDQTNIWLHITRKDLTPEKLVEFFRNLGLPVQSFVDPEDWQEIANVPDASEDPLYTGMKGVWSQTDDCQWRNDISDNVYELVEVRVIAQGYIAAHAVIDLECYSENDREDAIRGYYGSMAEFIETVPEDSRNGILAECIFEETSCAEVSYGKVFGTEEEAKRDALKYIVEAEISKIKQPASTLPDTPDLQKWMMVAAIHWGNIYSDCMCEKTV